MISFDLDMTLLDHKTGQITPSALKAVELLRKRHKIVLATGRDMDNYYSCRYRDILKPDGIVHMNGTKVTAGDFYIHPEVVEESDRLHWGISGRRFRDPGQLLNMKIRTLAFVGNEKQAAQIERDFPTLRLPLFAGKHGADVIEKGHSKADGLRLLAEYFGEDPSLKDTVAFGDSMNDIEIIQAAGTGVAMGNAIEELKACADFVTDSIEKDGIWKACSCLKLF